MYEKTSIWHPDKVADRISGALVDLAYKKQKDPKIAVEVLLGHGKCHIIAETSVKLKKEEVEQIVHRIAGEEIIVDYKQVAQDKELAKNQAEEFRCGDNGIFKGTVFTTEQQKLVEISKLIEDKYPCDGKYILDGKKLIICQSNAKEEDLRKLLANYKYDLIINPLGEWTGGTNVDCGATNRKLGSDMGDSVTGGGLCGKDLSKADVSVNIFCWLRAQENKEEITASCAIGDTELKVNGKTVKYKDIITIAKEYIKSVGGFEKFAEYGLLRKGY